jgi:uncharacterized protein YndB with AHSA1/START domain/uncharacterized glyoxalase superfamily protein PhnB
MGTGPVESWTPEVEIDMLVRRPAAEVWEAFADPERIRRFWLARSSGRLAPGAQVRWTFKVAGAATDVRVVQAVPGELLDLRWDDGQPLMITFEARDDATLVRIRVTDFGGDTPAANAVESMSGFTLVLASLKMWLEHGIEGDLMYDKFPDADYADRPDPDAAAVTGKDSFPILRVVDLPVVVDFYERLGFSQTYAFPADGPPAFVSLERDGRSIGIAGRSDAGEERFSYWVYVDDVDGTFDEMAATGARTEAAPRTEPWGERVASLRDPDGNVVHIGAPTTPPGG